MVWSDAPEEVRQSVLEVVRREYAAGAGRAKRGQVMRLFPYELRGVAHHAFTIVELEALAAKYGPPKQKGDK